MADNKGIAQLLEAEKEAAKVVAKARAYRVAKLKDAKTEALKEIEQLKATREAEFQQFLNQQKNNGNFKNFDTDMESKLQKIKQAFAKNQSIVIDKILEAVAPNAPTTNSSAAHQLETSLI